MENIIKSDADWINKSSINSILMLQEKEREIGKMPECKSVDVIFSNWVGAKWLEFTVRNVRKKKTNVTTMWKQTFIHPNVVTHRLFQPKNSAIKTNSSGRMANEIWFYFEI